MKCPKCKSWRRFTLTLKELLRECPGCKLLEVYLVSEGMSELVERAGKELGRNSVVEVDLRLAEKMKELANAQG